MSTPTAHTRTLVAGVGNIFRQDDGFGSEVARRLLGHEMPAGVRVVDYGIGGIHLAYDLLDGVEVLILIDTVPIDAEPGTLAVLEVDGSTSPGTAVDSHAMDPATVLANVSALGGTPPHTIRLVGCRPAELSDGMGLTPVVEASIEPAIRLVHAVLDEHHPVETPEPAARHTLSGSRPDRGG